MKGIGIVLIVLGILVLVSGGVSWTRKTTVIDAGPIEVKADKHESVPIPPLVGGAVLVSGLVLVVKSGRG